MDSPSAPVAVVFACGSRQVAGAAERSGGVVDLVNGGVAVTFTGPSEALEWAQRLTSVDDSAMVGMHVGEGGSALALSQALARAAGGGRVLVSGRVERLLGAAREWSFTPAGPDAWELVPEEVTPSGKALPLPPSLADDGLPFEGRHAAVSLLESCWERARDSRCRFVLITGEPGIGKSRLAAEFARAAHDQGATVLQGHCDPQPLAAYQPFVEALSHHVSAAGGPAVARAVGDRAGPLARLLPELGSSPATTQAPAVDSDLERLLVFDSITAVLAHVARRAPVLIVLDDLQWADRPTLVLLTHLVRAADPPGLLLIGTARADQVHPGHPLADVMADLRTSETAERIGLEGLDEADVRAVVAKRVGHELDDAMGQLASGLARLTEGNPLFLTHMLNHLFETGAIQQAGDRWRYAGGAGALDLPEGVRQVVGQRVARLSEPAQTALRAASVLGLTFDLSVLSQVTGLGPDQLLDVADEALAARLVVDVARPVDRLAFSHALVRSSLYEGLTTTRRKLLHERTGHALQAAGGDPTEVAHHFFEAVPSVPPAAVVAATVQAARAAIERTGYESAIVVCDRAQGYLVLDQDDPLRVDLLCLRAQAALALAEFAEARGDTAEAAELALRHGRVDDAADVLARWCRTARILGEVDEEMVARAEATLDALPPADSPPRARLMAAVNHQLLFAGNLDRTEASVLAAFEMGRRLGDPTALLDAVITYRSVGSRWPLAQRRADVLGALDEVAGLMDISGKVMAERHAMLLALERGDRDAFDTAHLEHESLATAARWPIGQASVLRTKATIALCEGRLSESQAAAKEAVRLAPDAVAAYAAQLFSIRREDGRLGELYPLMREPVERFPRVVSWRSALAMAAADAGDLDDARSLVQSLAPDRYGFLANEVAAGASLALLAEATAILEDPELAAPLVELLEPWVGQNIVVGEFICVGAADRYLGLAHATVGSLDEAVALLEAAVIFDERFGSCLWAAHDRVQLARVLRRRGRPGDDTAASELQVAAAEVAEVSGSERLRRLLAD